ncbi:MAG TPA: orotidine-5'-phosphate decarboxylase [Candidatus Omnitrophota bacterium]|jgi:orotidine-5'-phosphate decarboxylase|nr:orotidine-5'-phosphate decarboxylase [Candidatus Omnitrophota bacterium]
MKPEIILALDLDSLKKAKQLVNKLYPVIKTFKVGSQLFTACGPEVINVINKKGAKVFLDLKFFDIPNTVAHAVRNATRLKVKMLTLHILGDEEMIKAAVFAARDEAKRSGVKRPLLIGVTVLTSKETKSSDVLTLARIGIECGLDGVVCSAQEVKMLKEKIKRKFIIVTPGIRPRGSSVNDQKRTATISEAVKAGSSFLVVGRPILDAKDQNAAAREMAGEIDDRRDKRPN